MPMLWSVNRVAVVYLAISALNVFALVFVMTQGGPDRKTEVMLTYLYEKAFKNNEFGLATALAVCNFVIVMLRQFRNSWAISSGSIGAASMNKVVSYYRPHSVFTYNLVAARMGAVFKSKARL